MSIETKGIKMLGIKARLDAGLTFQLEAVEKKTHHMLGENEGELKMKQ